MRSGLESLISPASSPGNCTVSKVAGSCSVISSPFAHDPHRKAVCSSRRAVLTARRMFRHACAMGLEGIVSNARHELAKSRARASPGSKVKNPEYERRSLPSWPPVIVR